MKLTGGLQHITKQEGVTIPLGIFPDYYMSTSDLTLIKNRSIYPMLSLTQISHGISLSLTIIFRKTRDGLILYLIMLKIFHLYFTSTEITIDDMMFIMSLYTDIILVMGTY